MFKKRVASIGVTLSLLNNTAPIMSTHATPSSYYERQDYTLTTLVDYIDVIKEKLEKRLVKEKIKEAKERRTTQ